MATRFWPVTRDHVITSPFGPRWGGMHAGVDFGFNGGSANKPVYAIQSGTVIFAGAASGYGGPDPAGWLVIDSDDAQGSGCYEYGHIVREVGLGARVTAGQRIGHINPNQNTNGGVAPHLHLSFMPREYNPGTKQDPLPRLRDGALFPGGAPAPAPAPSAPKPTGKFVGEFQCAQTLLTSADSGRRPRPSIQVIHTNEGGPYARGKSPGSVAGLLAFCANTRNQASYNTIIGRGRNDSGRCNSDDYAPWAAGPIANTRGLHLCALGWSAQPRDEWLSYNDQIDTIAANLAHNSVVYDIPLVKLSAADVRAGRRGVCGHGETAVAWGETNHTDPGPAFPYDVVLARAQALVNGTQQPTNNGDDTMDAAQAMKLDRVYTELTQRYPSRSRRATDPTTPIDTLAGFVLNIDGRIHEMSFDIPERLAAIEASIAALAKK